MIRFLLSFCLLLQPPIALAQGSSRIKATEFEAPVSVFKLPKNLVEISGLAPAGEKSVYGHNDEHAIIHEISVDDGTVLRSFALGEPTVAGDFEAIARIGAFIYLVTSDGLIYEARPQPHAQRAAYNVYDTGLGKTCEIEGMAPDEEGGLLLLCKRSTLNKRRDRLILYRWRFEDRLNEKTPLINVALRDLAPRPVEGSFRASGLERDANTGNLLIIDSNAGAVLEITTRGAKVAYHAIGSKAHPQPEGVTILPSGLFVIADEGRKKKGALSIYKPR